MSYRTQIAEGFKAALLGNTPAEQSVHTKLDRPLQPADLPAVMIYASSARRGSNDFGNALIERLVMVHVESAIQSTQVNALTDADALAASIEAAIEADPSLGGVVNNTRWEQSTSDVSSFGEMTLGVCILEYTVSMYTPRVPAEPDGVLPTSVTINGTPTPQAYVQPLDDARLDPIDIVPSTIELDVVAPSRPPVTAGPLCDGDSCDIPAWTGDQP